MPPTRQALEVWGDFACFTRPELKVERLSYPVITPSAARGIFEAIYAKPIEFRWQVLQVEVLPHPDDRDRPPDTIKVPSYIALRRNEVKERASARAVSEWMAGKSAPEPLYADGDRELSGTDQKGRTQRQTMALRKPSYRLTSEIRPWPGHEGKQAALEAQFRRRAEGGKCFYQPYFGCREFPAYFQLADAGGPTPLPADLDIGFMLYDVFDLSRPGSAYDRPAVSLFSATLAGGVLAVPEYASADVRKVPGGAV